MGVDRTIHRCFGIVFLVLCCSFSGIWTATGQERTIDEILERFDHADAKGQKIIAKEFFARLQDLQALDEPVTVDEKDPADSVRAEVWLQGAVYFFDKQTYDKGITYSAKALPLLENGNDAEKLANCLSYLSACCFRTARYADAILYARKGLEIDRKSGDKSVISSDLSNIAAIFLAAKRPAEGKTYIQEAILNSTEAGDSGRMAIQMGIASEIFHSLGEDEQALQHAARAYEIDSVRGLEDKAAIRQCQMASALIALGRSSEAEPCLLQALPVLKASNNIQSYSIACNDLGYISLRKGQNGKAASYFKEALHIFERQGDRYNEVKSCKGLYLALKDSDPAEAMVRLERACSLKDTLYDIRLEEQIGEYSAQYKNDELQRKIEYESKARKTMSCVFLSILLLSLIIIALFWYALRVRMKMTKLMREMEEARTSFYTNLTHELRTPLSVIMGYGEQMIQGGVAAKDIQEVGKTLCYQGNSLLTLVNQMLDIAKVKSSIGAPEWKKGNVVRYIQMVVDSFYGTADQKHIELMFASKMPEIEMDFVPDYMKKILQNLISNALKYSDAFGKVNITTHTQDGNLVISIADNGKGISKEDLPHIFESFYRSRSDADSVGSGIGLTLVDNLVKAMSGSIDVRSSVGKGTVFNISLPLKHGSGSWSPLDLPTDMRMPQEYAPGEMKFEDLPQGKPTDDIVPLILIVEDNLEIARYIGSQLKEKYSIRYARNGQDGLDLASESIPDLILTDIMMPVMDGLALCRAIRKSNLTDHIPIIVISARCTEEDRIKGIKAGADAYLYKPFNADELNVRVTCLLDSRRLMRDKFAQSSLSGADILTEKLSRGDQLFLNRITDLTYAQMSGKGVDADAIASNLCITRQQLNRKLLAITGENTVSYLMHIRLSKARRLLDDPAHFKIGDIASECGFTDLSYFSRMFKMTYGVTPSQYRTRVR